MTGAEESAGFEEGTASRCMSSPVGNVRSIRRSGNARKRLLFAFARTCADCRIVDRTQQLVRARSTLGRFGARQSPVLRHVADRVLGFLQFLVKQRQVVVAIGHARIVAQRELVDDHRFDLALHVVEQHAEVVQQQRVVAAGVYCVAVDTLGFGRTPAFMQQAAEIDARVKTIGFGGDRAPICGDGRISVALFECVSRLDAAVLRWSRAAFVIAAVP